VSVSLLTPTLRVIRESQTLHGGCEFRRRSLPRLVLLIQQQILWKQNEPNTTGVVVLSVPQNVPQKQADSFSGYFFLFIYFFIDSLSVRKYM